MSRESPSSSQEAAAPDGAAAGGSSGQFQPLHLPRVLGFKTKWGALYCSAIFICKAGPGENGGLDAGFWWRGVRVTQVRGDGRLVGGAVGLSLTLRVLKVTEVKHKTGP